MAMTRASLVERYSVSHYPPLNAEYNFRRLRDRPQLNALLLVDDCLAQIDHVKYHPLWREVPAADKMKTVQWGLSLMGLDVPWSNSRGRQHDTAHEWRKKWRAYAHKTAEDKRVLRSWREVQRKSDLRQYHSPESSVLASNCLPKPHKTEEIRSTPSIVITSETATTSTTQIPRPANQSMASQGVKNSGVTDPSATPTGNPINPTMANDGATDNTPQPAKKKKNRRRTKAHTRALKEKRAAETAALYNELPNGPAEEPEETEIHQETEDLSSQSQSNQSSSQGPWTVESKVGSRSTEVSHSFEEVEMSDRLGTPTSHDIAIGTSADKASSTTDTLQAPVSVSSNPGNVGSPGRSNNNSGCSSGLSGEFTINLATPMRSHLLDRSSLSSDRPSLFAGITTFSTAAPTPLKDPIPQEIPEPQKGLADTTPPVNIRKSDHSKDQKMADQLLDSPINTQREVNKAQTQPQPGFGFSSDFTLRAKQMPELPRNKLVPRTLMRPKSGAIRPMDDEEKKNLTSPPAPALKRKMQSLNARPRLESPKLPSIFSTLAPLSSVIPPLYRTIQLPDFTPPPPPPSVEPDVPKIQNVRKNSVSSSKFQDTPSYAVCIAVRAEISPPEWMSDLVSSMRHLPDEVHGSESRLSDSCRLHEVLTFRNLSLEELEKLRGIIERHLRLFELLSSLPSADVDIPKTPNYKGSNSLSPVEGTQTSTTLTSAAVSLKPTRLGSLFSALEQTLDRPIMAHTSRFRRSSLGPDSLAKTSKDIVIKESSIDSNEARIVGDGATTAVEEPWVENGGKLVIDDDIPLVDDIPFINDDGNGMADNHVSFVSEELPMVFSGTPDADEDDWVTESEGSVAESLVEEGDEPRLSNTQKSLNSEEDFSSARFGKLDRRIRYSKGSSTQSLGLNSWRAAATLIDAPRREVTGFPPPSPVAKADVPRGNEVDISHITQATDKDTSIVSPTPDQTPDVAVTHKVASAATNNVSAAAPALVMSTIITEDITPTNTTLGFKSSANEQRANSGESSKYKNSSMQTEAEFKSAKHPDASVQTDGKTNSVQYVDVSTQTDSESKPAGGTESCLQADDKTTKSQCVDSSTDSHKKQTPLSWRDYLFQKGLPLVSSVLRAGPEIGACLASAAFAPAPVTGLLVVGLAANFS